MSQSVSLIRMERVVLLWRLALVVFVDERWWSCFQILIKKSIYRVIGSICPKTIHDELHFAQFVTPPWLMSTSDVPACPWLQDGLSRGCWTQAGPCECRIRQGGLFRVWGWGALATGGAGRVFCRRAWPLRIQISCCWDTVWEEALTLLPQTD